MDRLRAKATWQISGFPRTPVHGCARVKQAWAHEAKRIRTAGEIVRLRVPGRRFFEVCEAGAAWLRLWLCHARIC